MSARNVRVNCVVSPHLPAVLDADHRAMVNHEVFYFAGEQQKERFAENPLKYCGVLTDPVSRQRFVPGKDSPHRSFADRSFYFVSDSTSALFAAMPDSFATPRFGMMPKTGE